ncbi:hypothetical protein [Jiella sonneratiae]|uniref:Core-binding (CB) domain-containing protein n=1 Tax=Jiella sonneratiae TaxID=2816856 RepID=A0ABS3JAU9_9HYPH|nr:hypothetical protein [Jiella sonneratiae]MBO0906292.1 hypothetical protein [Jiella sonneratiae]
MSDSSEPFKVDVRFALLQASGPDRLAAMEGISPQIEDITASVFLRLCELQSESLLAIVEAQLRLQALAAGGDKAAVLAELGEIEAAHSGFQARLRQSGEERTTRQPRRAHFTPRVPHSVAAAGEDARQRYVAFFHTELQTVPTARQYATAAGRFFHWCERRGLGSVRGLTPELIGQWQRAAIQAAGSSKAAKVRISLIRRLLEWLILGGIVEARCREGLVEASPRSRRPRPPL